MPYAFSYCPADEAGRNIVTKLFAMLNQYNGIEKKPIKTLDFGMLYRIGDDFVIETERQHIFCDGMDDVLCDIVDIEGIVFISRHKSESGKMCLTCHSMGNFLEAHSSHGGRDKWLTPAMAPELACLLRAMYRNSQIMAINTPVSLEATHHGPALSIPALNIEIGSEINSWVRDDLGECVAKAIYEVFFRGREGLKAMKNRVDIKIGIGIGGGHYAPRYTDIVLHYDFCVGHIIPNYIFDQILDAEDELEVIRMAFEGTPMARYVYFDRKALKGERYRRYKSLAESIGLIAVRAKDLQPLGNL